MEWLESIIHVDVASKWGFLMLGFLIGLVHALEADHLAAVATMAKEGLQQKQQRRQKI